MYAQLAELEYFEYNEWDGQPDGIDVHCFDNLTDDELIALPAHIMMDAYRRTAQGGLIVEGGDETASMEVLKRIPDNEARETDFICQIDDAVVYSLPPDDNPYCNTTFAFAHVPPRVEEPRLPTSSNPSVTTSSIEIMHLSGLPGALSAAIEAVHLQRQVGGEASRLATYYSSVWGLGSETFMRPYIGPVSSASDIELISAHDSQQYLTYVDPAWQAVVTSTRPHIENKSFGPRALLHWDRLFYLARLQMIKGIAAMDLPLRKMRGARISLRIDADIVHHHHPRPHTLALPVDFFASRNTPQSLLTYIMNTVKMKVEGAIARSIAVDLGGLAVGNVGGLQLVAPTMSIPRRPPPSVQEIRDATHKVSEYFSRDRHPVVPGLNLMEVVKRVLEASMVIHEVHLAVIASIAYIIRTIDSVQAIGARLNRVADASHILAHNLGHDIGSRYGDSHVQGFLESMRGDVVRDRMPQYELMYTSTFGDKWSLPGSRGIYARTVQLICYMACAETLGHNRDYHVKSRILALHKDWRLKLHSGTMLENPSGIAATTRGMTPTMVHHVMVDNMRHVFGRLLEYEVKTMHWIREAIGRDLPEVTWIILVQQSKRDLLSAINYEPTKGGVVVHRDEERRVVINIIKTMNPASGHLQGDVDAIWDAAYRRVPTAAWVRASGAMPTVTTIRHVRNLREWFQEIVELHRGDHAALDLVLAKQNAPPIENPVRREAPPPELDTAIASIFMHREAAAPTTQGQMRMFSDLYSMVSEYDEESMDKLDNLDPEEYTIEQWVAAMEVANVDGARAGLRHLTRDVAESEIRD